MSSDSYFQGKTAAITGGASGIGLAVGKELAGRGAHLVLADIEEDALDRALEECAAAGWTARGVVCDVTSLASVEEFAETAFTTSESVDVVFNNAGVALGKAVADMSHDDWKWILDVDLWGPIHGVEAFLPRLIEQGRGGHLLFTSSFAGLAPNIGLGAYCVAKYGVVALAEVLHRELRSHEIGVSVLCPMRVATNIGSSERNRPGAEPAVPIAPIEDDFDLQSEEMAGRVLPVEGIARQLVEAARINQLYVVPHEESREMIRRRFDRIDRAFSSPSP